MLRLLPFLCLCLPRIQCAQSLLPFGTSAGDSKLVDFSMPIAVRVPINYYGGIFKSFFVSRNGLITFGEPFAGRGHEALFAIKTNVIAVFFAETADGQVYYRISREEKSNEQVFLSVTSRIQSRFPFSTNFHPLTLVVITWDRMTPVYGFGANTYQLVLISDDQESYALFLYEDIQWISSENDGNFAQAGFSATDGRHQSMVNSGTSLVGDLSELSNLETPGLFLFRITGPSPQDPRSMDHTEYSEYFEYPEYSDYPGYYDLTPEGNMEEYQEGEVPLPSDDHPCPPDRYHDNCPSNCQLLVDDRGCSLCLCTHSVSLSIGSIIPLLKHSLDGISEADQFNASTEMSTSETIAEETAEIAPPSRRTMEGIDPEEKYQDGKNTTDILDEILGVDLEISGGLVLENDKNANHTFNWDDYEGVTEVITEKIDEIGTPSDVPDTLPHPAMETISSTTPLTGHGSTPAAQPSLSPDLKTCHLVAVEMHPEKPCHPDGQCLDFQYGHCCRCLPGFYGNGLECLPNDEPQRINGGFGGNLNGVSLESTELHTYAVTSDGRVYTALSRIPSRFGPALLLLNPLGAVMGWLFAKVDHPTAYNGFQLTGGLFNRTVNVHIGEEHSVTIIQQFSGRDMYDYFKAKFDKNDVTILKVDRPHAVYDGDEAIVRYASANVVVGQQTGDMPIPISESHPESPPSQSACSPGNHQCIHPHMSCHPEAHSYRCKCHQGFKVQLDESVRLGWLCVDANECSLEETGDCDRNADCGQTNGIFKCQCRLGFHGSGKTCRRICRGHSECHKQAECNYDPETGNYHCQCKNGVEGDGFNNCGDSQDSVDPSEGNGLCDGHECHIEADCQQMPGGGNECVCRSGFHGNGIQCDSLNPEYPREDAESDPKSIGPMCSGHDQCSEWGLCAYNALLNYYQCRCQPPYIGDGITCAMESAPPITCDQLPNCHRDAQCIFDSDISRHVCRCLKGYSGDGYGCTPEIQLETGILPTDIPARCFMQTDCHENGHCILDDSSDEYICECLPGFGGDGVDHCQPADECNPADISTCEQHSECLYGELKRAYICQCVQGFIRDGPSCRPFQESVSCDSDPGICHSNADCVLDDRHDLHQCVCRPGSQGDGHSQCTVIGIAPLALSDTWHSTCSEGDLHLHCTNCSIHAECRQQDDQQWICGCSQGYQGNGYLCTPFVTCLDDDSICDPNADCVPGEQGQYICDCHFGFHGNGRVCHPDSQLRGSTLLIGRGMAVIERGLVADIPGKQLIVVPNQIAVGVDFDCRSEQVVWADIAGHSLRMASLNGSNQREYLTAFLNSPEGIAVDFSSQNVYYTDSTKDQIGVLSMDGKYHKVIFDKGLVNPRALALDLHNSHLYYSDWDRSHPLIGRVDLDGSHHFSLVTSDVHLPNGLALLHDRREVCWVDAGQQRLSCIGMDGQGRRVVHAPLEYPFGLTVHLEQTFYWTDWKEYGWRDGGLEWIGGYFSNRVHTVDIHGRGYSSFQTSVGGSGKVYGIVAVPDRCISVETACSENNGGCPYLCLPKSEGGVSCICPDSPSDLPGC